MLPGAHRQVHERAKGWAIYWYAWRGGAQIARFDGETIELAEAAEIAGAVEIAAQYAAEYKPRPADGTVSRAVHAFIASPEWKALALKTQQAWDPWLHQIRERWGAQSGEEFASDATAIEVREWRDEIAGRSTSTADKAMEAVSRLCSYARNRSVGLLPRDCNPTEGLKKAYKRPLKLPPPRAEVLAAIEALPPLAAAICEIALNTGLRRSDLVRLSDTHVDVATGIVRLGTKKGEHMRRVASIKLTPPLLDAIRRAQMIRDALYAHKLARARQRGLSEPVRPLTVIVNTRCKAFTANGLYQHIRDAFEIAKKERINPHSFRRAAATQRFLSGLSWAQIGRELGWGEAEAETMGAIYVPDEAVAQES
jgi:integrase